MARRSKKGPKQVEALKHDAATRRNIPTAELQSTAERMEELSPFEPVTYQRSAPLAEGHKRDRDEDLDPQIVWKGTSIRLTKDQIEALKAGEKVELGEAQLVWRGKDNQDWSDLVVQAPPLYIQEKIHPKAIIEGLKRQTKERREEETDAPDLFGDFNGLDPEAKTEFYQHDQHWQNRMILGDSFQVMASLAERENLRGKVQCIYFDPPYGIKFNSNWQVSTQSRDVKDGKLEQLTREPEQVKAFRDTWNDGIHSYLTYLRDRFTVMRDLLTATGSIFVQIGDENVHRVRALMDEVFGAENFVVEITVVKTSGLAASSRIASSTDYILWYARDQDHIKYRKLTKAKDITSPEGVNFRYLRNSSGLASRLQSGEQADPDKAYRVILLTKPGPGSKYEFEFEGETFSPGSRWWGTTKENLERVAKAGRITKSGSSIGYLRAWKDYDVSVIDNVWADTGTGGFLEPKIYVVQTIQKIVQRCILMATDPGDLVLDPTCGSGTTATVAEQWGRRWITIDTSRVALALARTRLMSSRYPFYLLADSAEGREKEQEVSGEFAPDSATRHDLRQGFVYRRAPHIMMKTVANNTEIDVIWDKWQTQLEPLRNELNEILGADWQEWEIPGDAEPNWSDNVAAVHARWWELRRKRQQEIDKSIEQKADDEFLYDRPYEDNSKVRVAGPFTVESLSPHRVISADEDTLIEEVNSAEGNRPRPKSGPSAAPAQDFATMVLDNLKSAGVHQSDKGDRIEFTAMEGWPGDYIAATGTFEQSGMAKRAAVFIGPEFGSITRSDIMAAAREANDARFDVLIACGFNFDAHSSEVSKLGPLPILKAKMNPDLHMADDLKNTGKGNLFVVFGEPDVEWDFDNEGNIVVEVLGVDVFDPKTGEVRASGKGDIAAWFIDTDYDEESFFVRHAYFLGANDPYKSLKTSLKAEIDKEAWETLYRDTSRPFERPSTGRFAVKVINHFGDEVMKVFSV
ncbi:MAG: site-specific DNA-methyltransferase [Pseudomonadota bacterium]